MIWNRMRWPLAAIAILAALVLIAGDADARGGGGKSFGSRGSRTFSPPPVTQTAPRPASPMERTMTQPSQLCVGTHTMAPVSVGFCERGVPDGHGLESGPGVDPPAAAIRRTTGAPGQARCGPGCG